MVNDFSPRRRVLALGGAGLALGLSSCALPEADAPAAKPGDPGRLVTPWLSLTGGWRVEDQALPQVARPTGQRVNFVQPTGVVARNDVVLIADAGARTIWRMERSRDTLGAFAAFGGNVPDHGTSMQLGNDLMLWVALPAEHRVAQYDFRGRLVRRWGDDMDAPRPVAVVVAENRSEVLVGDAATARVVVFDLLGRPLGVLGGRRTTSLQSLTAMALGPRGLYVLDRAAQQVVVFDARGLPVQAIGDDQLVQPRALAVDASGRVFVSDELEQRIKVFRGAKLLASFGGQGNGPGRFGRIEAMALDGNLLYVADSANARVQVLLVSPASMETPEAPR